MDGNDVAVNVVREGVDIAVEGMEGVGGKGSRNCGREYRQQRIESDAGATERTNKSMVRFVESLVEHGVVEHAVDPVDGVVGEEEESDGTRGEIRPLPELAVEPRDLGGVGEGGVELGVAPDVAEDPGEGEEADGDEGIHREFYLLLDLVREEAGVGLHAVIEDGVVRDERKGEVEEEDSEIWEERSEYFRLERRAMGRD